MPLIVLPDYLIIIISFIIWPVIQIGGAFLALKIPDRLYNPNNLIFKTKKFEKNGKFYNTVFKVKKWKHLLPDGAAVIKSGYRKKHIKDLSVSNLEKFIIESCRAELTHIIPILLTPIFLIFTNFYTFLIMLLYSLISNLPCLIAQRYNRPRIINMLNIKKKDR